jgi:hypothetical protein
MALGETCWITKKGITRWFHKKNMFLRTQYISADYAIVRSYMELHEFHLVIPFFVIEVLKCLKLFMQSDILKDEELKHIMIF